MCRYKRCKARFSILIRFCPVCCFPSFSCLSFISVSARWSCIPRCYAKLLSLRLSRLLCLLRLLRRNISAVDPSLCRNDPHSQNPTVLLITIKLSSRVSQPRTSIVRTCWICRTTPVACLWYATLLLTWVWLIVVIGDGDQASRFRPISYTGSSWEAPGWTFDRWGRQHRMGR